MDIKTAIAIIKDQLSKSEQTGDMFELCGLENAKITVKDLPNEGADFLRREYCIELQDGNTIQID